MRYHTEDMDITMIYLSREIFWLVVSNILQLFHLTRKIFLFAFPQWMTVCKNSGHSAAYGFAQDNFLSVRTMEDIASMKRQFVDLLSSIGFLESPDPKLSISRRRAEQLARQTRGDGVIEVTGEFANR